jgi:hypothetical protein
MTMLREDPSSWVTCPVLVTQVWLPGAWVCAEPEHKEELA